MKPSAFQIFCGYYLGLDKDFGTRFFNIHSLAGHYGISTDELHALMDEYHILPEDMVHIDFNIAKAHGIAQELDFSGQHNELILFAKKSFDEFTQALGGIDKSKVFEDLDYDNVWGDEPDGNQKR